MNVFCLRYNLSLLSCCALVLAGSAAYGRQNVLIGALSVRYDHQDRTYEDGGLVTETPDGEIVAGDVGDTGSGATIVVLEDRRGDRRQYVLSPRLTFSSTGIADLLELTYAPALNYDHLNGSTDLDHDFGLQAERNLSKNWLVSLNNRFFLGDDPVRGEEFRTAAIVPETGEPVVEDPTVGSPNEGSEETLTERFGRRRYWTNSLSLNTNYGYGAERTLNAGYTLSVLRNDDSETVGGYTDYDRHTGVLSLDHRFNKRWSGFGEGRYSRGLFDEPDVFLVTAPEEGDTRVDQATGGDSDDLSEYNLRVRGRYDTSPRLHLFAEYSYLNTDYDAEIREDYSVNNVALGIDYDIFRHLHVTLSGGPSWGAFENSPTESDYNAYAGLTWGFMHGTATFFADKGYDQSNFDGRRSGLTDFWRTGITLEYRLTQDLKATFSGSYRDNRRLQYPVPQTIVIIDDGQAASTEQLPVEELDRVEYTENDYDAGLSLTYTFLRWYTLSGGYRYYNHDSGLAESGTGSYGEHRAFVQLAVSKELFRW